MDISGGGGSARPVPEVIESEAGETALAGTILFTHGSSPATWE